MKKNETNKAIEGLFPTLEETLERKLKIQETEKEQETQRRQERKTPQQKKPIGRPKINPEEPYKITFIVDEEIEDYMKQQPFITMETRKDYINRLIKEDFEKRIGATSRDNQDSIQKKWIEYKERIRRSF